MNLRKVYVLPPYFQAKGEKTNENHDIADGCCHYDNRGHFLFQGRRDNT